MGRMARIKDVVALSSREKLHVGINKVVAVCLLYVGLFTYIT